jgi:dGTPase
MDWNNCFSNERYGVTDTGRTVRNDFERDWDRLIFSSAFRRLQNKTQVFPLPDEVFVHNRLTHSLEVACVGRSLGKLVGREICQLEDVKSIDNSRRFYRNHLKNVIAAACLAHDMGNPAFGHSGEDAISKYFLDMESGDESEKEFIQQFTDSEWKDLTTFEGNANAIRVLTKHVKGRTRGGFRLTYSTLGAIIKYPCESKASKGRKGPLHRKKYGFFQIDKHVFLEIVEKLNMVKEASEDGVVYKRHPFTYLVEAADDICYNVIDFEDAHRLGILGHEEVTEMFLSLIRLNPKEDFDHIGQMCTELDDDKNEKIAYLRAKVINYLTERCAQVFLDNKEEILAGTFEKALLEEIDEAKEILKKIEDVSVERIYNYHNVVKIELAGFRIMSGLIEDLVEAALTPKDERVKRHKKVLKLMPKSFLFEEEDMPYKKIMCVIDYISGMTDLYALKLYKNLRGIDIPSI